MPNGGSDCCGTCWHNRANGGEAGIPNRDGPRCPNYCEICRIDIPNPFYTYCANHPHHRPIRDPIPIGPVFVNRSGGVTNERENWQPSPDTEEIRQHLLQIIRTPREHLDKGYHWYAPPAFVTSAQQLASWGDERVVDALVELIARPDMQQARESLEDMLRYLRRTLAMNDASRGDTA